MLRARAKFRLQSSVSFRRVLLVDFLPLVRRSSPLRNGLPAPRLLGGTRRGLLLKTHSEEGMRPTAARARKALFDTLTHRPALRAALMPTQDSASNASPTEDDLWLLDAFAGSGALGLEALSRWQECNRGYNKRRGAFFEKDAATAQTLRDNIERSGLNGQVFCADALAPRASRTLHDRGTVKLAFFDPPYAMPMEEAVRAPAAFAKQGWFSESALIVFQRAAKREPSLSLGEDFVPLGTLSSSSACFFFFRYAPPSLPVPVPQTSEPA